MGIEAAAVASSVARWRLTGHGGCGGGEQCGVEAAMAVSSVTRRRWLAGRGRCGGVERHGVEALAAWPGGGLLASSNGWGASESI
jgi:hypothetical protein